MTIIFTATISKAHTGFVARADELGIHTKPASTARGAVKGLKDLVRLHIEAAKAHGRLTKALKEAGYRLTESAAGDIQLEVPIHDSQRVELSMPHIPLYTGKGRRL